MKANKIRILKERLKRAKVTKTTESRNFYTISFVDGINVSDVMTNELAGPNSFIDTFTDSVSVSDVFNSSQKNNYVDVFNESISVSDVVDSSLNFAQFEFSNILSDIVRVTDTIAVVQEANNDTVESLAVTDFITTVMSMFESFTETINVTEQFTNEQNFFYTEQFTDEISISEDYSETASFNNQLLEAINISDFITDTFVVGLKEYLDTFTESITVNDLMNLTFDNEFTQQYSDNISVSDSFQNYAVMFEQRTEANITPTDSITTQLSGQNGSTEELSVTDFIQTTMVMFEYFTDSISVSDSFISNNPITTTPTLISPSNGQQFVLNNTVFDWSDVPNASNYDLQVSLNSTFTNLIVNINTSNSNYSVSGLANNTTYYWRVRGKNSSNTGNWSSVSSFSTINPQAYSNIFTENVGVSDILTTQLQASNAITESVVVNETITTQMSMKNTFTDSVIVSDSITSNLILGVRDLTLVYPLNDSVVQPITFEWTIAQNSNIYDIEISTTSNFSNIVLSNSLNALEYTTSSLVENTVYYWRVRGRNTTNGMIGNWASSNFEVVPAKITPSNVDMAGGVWLAMDEDLWE